MTLVSVGPKAYPHFEYNYFTEEVDRKRMRFAIRTAYKLLKSDAMKHIVKHTAGLTQEIIDSDDLLDKYMLKHLITGIHMSGTAKFAVGEDPTAVADQYGKVLGVENLRVVDTSILPNTTSRGPANTTVMIGELMADVIKSGN